MHSRKNCSRRSLSSKCRSFFLKKNSSWYNFVHWSKVESRIGEIGFCHSFSKVAWDCRLHIGISKNLMLRLDLLLVIQAEFYQRIGEMPFQDVLSPELQEQAIRHSIHWCGWILQTIVYLFNRCCGKARHFNPHCENSRILCDRNDVSLFIFPFSIIDQQMPQSVLE